MASDTTDQFSFKSASILVGLTFNFFTPFCIDFKAIKICPNGTPIFLNTVLSVKSLCNLEIGNFEEKKLSSALAIPKLPSAFSKSMGFTLCGMAEEPTSFSLITCLK